jgi:hypothetical protein
MGPGTTKGLNNFRQNKQPGSEFAAPDAIVSLLPQCSGPYGLVATVTNIGEAALPAGVVVGFYRSPSTLLGSGATTKPLYSLESEKVFLALSSTPPGTVYAKVDDTTTPHPEWTECRTENNQSQSINPGCSVPK